MTSAQIEEIIQLRSRKVSPKQIARKLGLRPAEVTAIIKQQSEAGHIQKPLAELKAVWINSNAARHLLQLSAKGSKGQTEVGPDSDGGGLAQVILVRVDEKNHHWVSSYLIDTWCLGIKNTFGPRQLTRNQLDVVLRETEERFGHSLQEITLEQAQSVVFGAVDYAKSLGFDPHRDFKRSRPQLGSRPDTLLEMEFGKDGQPFFMSGPYDDADKIMATLRETVGEGNFNYVVGLGPPPDDFF